LLVPMPISKATFILWTSSYFVQLKKEIEAQKYNLEHYFTSP
jgi:hypothetical protein